MSEERKSAETGGEWTVREYGESSFGLMNGDGEWVVVSNHYHMKGPLKNVANEVNAALRAANERVRFLEDELRAADDGSGITNVREQYEAQLRAERERVERAERDKNEAFSALAIAAKSLAGGDTERLRKILCDRNAREYVRSVLRGEDDHE